MALFTKKNAILLKNAFLPKFLDFLKLFFGLIICFGDLCVNLETKICSEYVAFCVDFFFFDYQIFSFYRKWEFSIFLEIVSIIFCLITHFIKVIQTVQNQKIKIGLKFVNQNVPKEYE